MEKAKVMRSWMGNVSVVESESESESESQSWFGNVRAARV